MEVYSELLDRVGPRDWWPADTPFEVIVGAILTQNTTWKNVEKAITNLKNERLLDAESIRDVSLAKLAETIRPAGYYNRKAFKLKEFVRYFFRQHRGLIAKMRSCETDLLRQELLSVHGIGPETADAILLYALDKPIFVVDSYTKRILYRHRWYKEQASYQEVQEFFMKRLPRDKDLFNEYHALIDFVGHHYCRATPRCDECPLRDRLP